MLVKSLGFWNNKGGTGKTSLTFQAVCSFANKNPDARILVIDVCPQANLSELFFGGQENSGGKTLLEVQGGIVRKSVGGYFQTRLPNPNVPDNINTLSYLSSPAFYNDSIPRNISLLAGDPLLELQANAMATLANNQIPGVDSWAGVVKWLIDFKNAADEHFDYLFIDMNPSFSMYTQIALAACDRIVLPVTADDSSRRGIQNALSLMYGLKLPSDTYALHNFKTKMDQAKLEIPRVHLVVKNRLTQYVVAAKGYAAVLEGIDSDLGEVIKSHPKYITFDDVKNGVAEVRDFQTAGVVAFARGTPFTSMKSGTLSVAGRRVVVNKERLELCTSAIELLADKLW